MLVFYREPIADAMTAAAEPRKGGAMSATQQRTPLSSYRDAVTELIAAGERFGDIEDAIDEIASLTLDQKAALWLFAFSLLDRGRQRADARAYLDAVA